MKTVRCTHCGVDSEGEVMAQLDDQSVVETVHVILDHLEIAPTSIPAKDVLLALKILLKDYLDRKRTSPD